MTLDLLAFHDSKKNDNSLFGSYRFLLSKIRTHLTQSQ